MALRALPILSVLAHLMGLPPPCPWPGTPCQPPRLPLTFPMAQNPTAAPQSCQPLPQWCYSRAGLQLPKALPWLAMGPAKPGPTTGPCPQGSAWWRGWGWPGTPKLFCSWLGVGRVLAARSYHHPPGEPLVLLAEREHVLERLCWLWSLSISFLEINKMKYFTSKRKHQFVTGTIKSYTY